MKTSSLKLPAEVLDLARKLGLDATRAADPVFADGLRRVYVEHWNEENKDAIAAYNSRVQREGLPLAKYRSFMKCR
jgi:antitoxin CcdA